MRIRKALGVSATFVGTVIGAGFASGREICLYFSRTSVISCVAAGLIMGALCFVFTELGRRYDGDVTRAFGSAKKAVKIVLSVSAFVSLVAMLSGSNDVFYALFSIKHGDIIMAMMTLFAVLLGKSKLKILNTIVVPLILALVVTVAVKGYSSPPHLRLGIINAASYAGMNILLGGYVVGSLSKSSTVKENALASFLSFVMLTALIIAILGCSYKFTRFSMPFLTAAETVGLGAAGYVVMLLAVYTTAVSDLYTISSEHKKTAVVVTAVCLPLTVLPFSSVVDFTYPILGVAGVILSLYCVAVFIFSRRA